MKSRTAYLAATLLSSTVALSGAEAQDMVYKDKSAPIEARVDDLMGRLTLDEKILLLAGESSMTLNPVPRLGIPAIQSSDASAIEMIFRPMCRKPATAIRPGSSSHPSASGRSGI